jgi:alkylation response protein AidB-like acyl-CoA dehydrogenase
MRLKNTNGLVGAIADPLYGLELAPAHQRLRQEAREWLAENLTDDFRAVAELHSSTDDHNYGKRLEWERKLADAGWLGMTWPVEYGGRGLTQFDEVIFFTEHARAGAPYWTSMQGWDLFGPLLNHYGTDAQKQRFMPGIRSCTEFWGQGYSEPEGGSDLASLRTKAVRDGNEWVVDGQKIWTSFGKHANWLYVLCRTDPEVPKHKGISLLLVPVDQPGVDVRPIRHMGGGNDFCEVFFDGARTEADLVLGGEGNGWNVAMGSLGIERLTTTMVYQLGFSDHLRKLVEEVRRRGMDEDPRVRRTIADAWTNLRINELLNLRVLTGLLHGDTPDAMTSVAKLRWSAWHKKATSEIMNLLGASEMIVADGYELDVYQGTFLNSVAETIYGGANEIQQNIIAERLLGLPRA